MHEGRVETGVRLVGDDHGTQRPEHGCGLWVVAYGNDELGDRAGERGSDRVRSHGQGEFDPDIPVQAKAGLGIGQPFDGDDDRPSLHGAPHVWHPRKVQRRGRQRLGFWYGFVVGVVKPLLLLLTKKDWRGMEHVPSEGGIIVAANHVSEIDPLVIGHYLVDLHRPPRFLAKAELFRKAPLRWIVEGAKQIPVSRRAADASAALGPAVEAIKAGECVLIYPEGSATRDPNLWPMKARTGVARVALMSGAPVIPVAIWGPEAILAYKARRPKLFPRRTMRVVAGPPVDLSAYVGKPLTAELLHAATDTIMRRIADQLSDLRGEPAPAEFYDMKTATNAVKESA